MQRIFVVVVTYNRLELLKRNIAALRQNQPIEQIIVVNNGSVDGTEEWLAGQPDLCVITQENVGGSGGFYRGMKEAVAKGADWVWCMDDDVFPHSDCLTQLLKEADDSQVGILVPQRLIEGKVFATEFRAFNMTNPFTSTNVGKLKHDLPTTPTDIAGATFEGPFIRRTVIDRIGLPNKELFIFYDDTDYCLRTLLAGYKVRYVPNAQMDKHRFFAEDGWSEKQAKKKWKRFYQIRNATYLNHHYGKNWGVRYFRGFQVMVGYLFLALFTAPFAKAWRWCDIPRLYRAYADGVKERLGKMTF
jgi:GT2 family glycosyltransferase